MSQDGSPSIPGTKNLWETMSMPLKPYLTLAQADAICAAARVEAQSSGFDVTIVVTDDAGNIMRLDRFDGAPLVSLTVAEGKARTSVAMKATTSDIQKLAVAIPTIVAIPGVLPFPGGVPLMQDGVLIGAIGVSGVQEHEDEQIAIAGARALIW